MTAVSEVDRAAEEAIMRAGGDGGEPRARACDGGHGGPAVAARRGDEHARLRREEERHLHLVEEVRLGGADGMVEDVHAVGDRLIDGGCAVGPEAGG